MFNTGSGDTHVLDVFSGEVLRRLQEGPATASEVARQLDEALALETAELPAERLEQVLTEFRDLGLIESALQ